MDPVNAAKTIKLVKKYIHMTNYIIVLYHPIVKYSKFVSISYYVVQIFNGLGLLFSPKETGTLSLIRVPLDIQQ